MIRPAASQPLSTQESDRRDRLPVIGGLPEHRAGAGVEPLVEEAVDALQAPQGLEGPLQAPAGLIRADDLQPLGRQHAPQVGGDVRRRGLEGRLPGPVDVMTEAVDRAGRGPRPWRPRTSRCPARSRGAPRDRGPPGRRLRRRSPPHQSRRRSRRPRTVTGFSTRWSFSRDRFAMPPGSVGHLPETTIGGIAGKLKTGGRWPAPGPPVILSWVIPPRRPARPPSRVLLCGRRPGPPSRETTAR